MGSDRNTVIGFILLALLFFGYFWYSSQGKLAMEKEQQHIQDSLRIVQHRQDSTYRLTHKDTTTTQRDTTVKVIAGAFSQDSSLSEQTSTLENELIKITFTNKGAQPKRVELKKFKTFDGKPLILQNGQGNKISYAINAPDNHTLNSADLLFKGGTVQTGSDGSQSISFQLQGPNGESIEHKYSLPANNYMLDFSINLNGADKLITGNTVTLLWQTESLKAERNIEYERLQSQVAYVENGDYDFNTLGSGNDKKFVKPVDWLCVKQQFFATAILDKSKFQNADVQWVVPADTAAGVIARTTANLRHTLPASSIANVPLQLYYGPSDYKILKSYGNQMHNIVPLGSGMFAFVKYINRGFVYPIFNFLSKNIASFGLVIAFLTIIIRLLISPITYQSYLSGAKMKLLKPEIDALKAKYGDDKQGMSMEQMKLFKSAGVNPLGGCIPALLQIPIFFALYNFFNSNISLRGEHFLWAKDLSAYDSIVNLPFNIPLYGDHVSLFTILATGTSLLISLYGMSNMQDNSNPMMKYLPFIFPVILLGVFNKLPSALTWYYTVSNVITLLIQFVIQKYIINHEKVLAQLQANKLKPKSKSKWQEKIEAMQESQKKLQDMKQKTGKHNK
jgi:YidC/Oxa1 family membrane protein insertase